MPTTTLALTPEVASALAEPGVFEQVVPAKHWDEAIDLASAVLFDDACSRYLASLGSIRSYLTADREASS